MMEPTRKRAIAFVDGQNLFHSAKDSFGYTFPNFDIRLLVDTICAAQGWDIVECRFYTGIPNPGTMHSGTPFGSRKPHKWEDQVSRSSLGPCAIAIRSFDFRTAAPIASLLARKRASMFVLLSIS